MRIVFCVDANLRSVFVELDSTYRHIYQDAMLGMLYLKDIVHELKPSNRRRCTRS